MTPDQRQAACEAIFRSNSTSTKNDQQFVMTLIAKHRGWNSSSQIKTMNRNLGPIEKGRACFEVVSAHPQGDMFYLIAVKDWMRVNYLKDIGRYLDKVGIPNESGCVDSIKNPVEVKQLVALLIAHRDDPAPYSCIYCGYLLIEGKAEGRGKENTTWCNAPAALELALGNRSLANREGATAALPEKKAEQPAPFQESALSMYERAMIKSLVEGAISRTGRLASEEAEQLVRQLIDVAPGQVSHCFLLGFAQALYGMPMVMLDVGTTAARSRWHVSGYLLGRARSGRLREVYDSMSAMDGGPLDLLLEQDGKPHPELLECASTMARMFVLADDHGRLARLCGMFMTTPVGSMTYEVVGAALGTASKLISEEKYDAAVALINAALEALRNMQTAHTDEATSTFYKEVAAYRTASALLGMRKFKEAQAIYAKFVGDAESPHRMGARVWMSLSKAGLTRVEELFPQGLKEKFEEVMRKLKIVSEQVERDGAATHRLAQICSGLWLQSEKRHAEAIKAFDRALASMTGDSTYRRRKIQQWTALCRAVSLVHELSDDHRHDIRVAFQEAKDAGVKPSPWYLQDMAAPLGYFADSELVDLLGQLLPEGDQPAFYRSQWASGAVKSDPRLQVTYLSWLESSDEPLESKWDHTVELLKTGWRSGGAAPEDALDFLSFLSFQDSRFAGRLIEVLSELGPSDGMLSQHELTTLRARLHASRGELPQAIALLTQLFFNVANAPDAYLQQMALAIYDDIAEMRGDLEALRGLHAKLVAQAEADTDVEPDFIREAGPIYVLYVGGNEVQRRYEDDVRSQIVAKYPNVTLEYFCPGWSSNWNKVVDIIRPKLANADGLLLSYYVRTMFGRTIRKACPDNCPWWGADGHGKASIIRGLEKAIQHAALRRRNA